MRNFWIITVENPWCDLLLRGLKTMELRRRLPHLQAGDVIFVCRKGDGTAIVGAFKLVSVGVYKIFLLGLPKYVRRHRLKDDELKRYANGSSFLYGLTLSRLRFSENLKVEDFGYVRNPQWFYRVKTDWWHKIPQVIMKGGEE